MVFLCSFVLALLSHTRSYLTAITCSSFVSTSQSIDTSCFSLLCAICLVSICSSLCGCFAFKFCEFCSLGVPFLCLVSLLKIFWFFIWMLLVFLYLALFNHTMWPIFLVLTIKLHPVLNTEPTTFYQCCTQIFTKISSTDNNILLQVTSWDEQSCLLYVKHILTWLDKYRVDSFNANGAVLNSPWDDSCSSQQMNNELSFNGGSDYFLKKFFLQLFCLIIVLPTGVTSQIVGMMMTTLATSLRLHVTKISLLCRETQNGWSRDQDKVNLSKSLCRPVFCTDYWSIAVSGYCLWISVCYLTPQSHNSCN